VLLLAVVVFISALFKRIPRHHGWGSGMEWGAFWHLCLCDAYNAILKCVDG